MPLPHVVARVNKRVTNRFIEPIARRSGGFAVVHHVGRRSGAPYSTPVNVFDLHGDLLVALTYGSRADWFQNALVGDAQLERKGDVRLLESVELVGRDTAWSVLPWFVRPVLRLLRVTEFARLRTTRSAISPQHR